MAVGCEFDILYDQHRLAFLLQYQSEQPNIWILDNHNLKSLPDPQGQLQILQIV